MQSDDTGRRCAHCDGEIGGTPIHNRGEAYHSRCAFEGHCELCGIDIDNDANLSPIKYNGTTVKACPGCHGAAGGES